MERRQDELTRSGSEGDDDVPEMVSMVTKKCPRLLQRRSTGIFSKMNSINISFEDQLFEELSRDGHSVSVCDFVEKMADLGLSDQDPRLQRSMKNLKQSENQVKGGDIHRDVFKTSIRDNIVFIQKAVKDFVVADFKGFTNQISSIYEACKDNEAGVAAPHAASTVRPPGDIWAVSVCTVDGQRYSVGDSGELFSLASLHKPLTYALALDASGSRVVHRYVGHEPSGQGRNVIKLNNDGKPHNPMMTTGALVTTSLIHRHAPLAERIAYVSEQYSKLAGNDVIRLNNDRFNHLQKTSYQDHALGYYLLENQCFPDGTDFKETLDLYFRLNSFEMTCDTASVMAATLANGGICPMTGKDVLSGEAVRNMLSLMHSCGLYEYSGQFAFKVGLPAKSSHAGVILLVVPNLFGLCLWSPLLDQCGNSVRGIQFCEQMVQQMNLHHYTLRRPGLTKNARRHSVVTGSATDQRDVIRLMFAARDGDLNALKRMYLSGVDVTGRDYDGRTALHIAAAEGHVHCVRFLVQVCHVPIDPKDRWGNGPLQDAEKFHHKNVVCYLQSRLDAH